MKFCDKNIIILGRAGKSYNMSTTRLLTYKKHPQSHVDTIHKIIPTFYQITQGPTLVKIHASSKLLKPPTGKDVNIAV